jgi:hypothetical protein
MRNNWYIVGIIIILIGFDIFIHIPIVDIQSSYFGAIIGFVGVLATFIVVSNYAQVKDIEKKFNERANKLELAFDKKIKSRTTNIILSCIPSGMHPCGMQKKIVAKKSTERCIPTGMRCLWLSDN